MKTAQIGNQPVSYSHFSNFVRSKDNLREIVEREELLALIKADGGVKVPGYVYSESKNLLDPETGKSLMVIYDMNSRHWCLEQLSKDEEYLTSGGSLDLPYLILSDDIADDPVKERMFMISLGTSNKQLSPKEIGRGYTEALSLKMDLLKAQFEGWDNLSAEEQENQEKKFKTQVLKQIVKESGKSTNDVYKIFRVFDAIDELEELGDALEKDQITVSSADELLKVAKKESKNPEELLNIAQKVAFDRNKERVSDADIAQAAKIIKHPQISKYVASGSIHTQYVDDVIKAAEKAKTDIAEIVGLAQEFGGVNPASLIDVIQSLNESDVAVNADSNLEAINKYSEDIEDEESLEIDEKDDIEDIEDEISVSKKETEEAKEAIMEFTLKMSKLMDNGWEISDLAVVAIAEKLEKVHSFIKKNSKQF